MHILTPYSSHLCCKVGPCRDRLLEQASSGILRNCSFWHFYASVIFHLWVYWALATFHSFINDPRQDCLLSTENCLKYSHTWYKEYQYINRFMRRLSADPEALLLQPPWHLCTYKKPRSLDQTSSFFRAAAINHPIHRHVTIPRSGVIADSDSAE